MTMDDKSDVRPMPTKGPPPIQEDPRKNGKLPAQSDTSGEMDAAGGGRRPAPEARPKVAPALPGNVATVPKKGPDSGQCDTDPKKQSC